MRISNRGNFVLDPGRESGDDGRRCDAEAEWAAQWEPTIQCTASDQSGKVGAGVPTETEVVISLRPLQTLRIKIVA